METAVWAKALSERTDTRTLRRSAHILTSLCVLVAQAGLGHAAITIEGVADRKVYTDRVSFVVRSAPGIETAAQLNGRPIALDTPVEVSEPQYYEIVVRQQEGSPGAEADSLVRFIVRASSRGNTEWGLPVWTPYPSIDSAAAEFAGARLEVVVPAAYPMGLEIPVIARVQDPSGRRIGVNGTIAAIDFPDHSMRLLRGVGSVFLPAAAGSGVLSYSGSIQSLVVQRQIDVEASTAWRTVSQDVAASVDWGEDARIRISGAVGGVLTIASEATLTIGAGSVIVVDPGITVAVEGRIVVAGTVQRPVVFTAQDRTRPWGGFLFETGASGGEFTGAIFTASGADPSWFANHPGHGHSHRSDQCLFYLSNGARVSLTGCFLVENHGQAGHGEGSTLTLTGCLIQRCVTAGQYNGGAVVARDCAFVEFPSGSAPFVDGDNDAFYLTGGSHSFTDCLLGWALDDAIDAGDGPEGSVTFDRCWIESCYHEALALSSGPRHVKVADTVALNCGQGIECGYGDPDVDADRCLCTGNLVGARFGDNYDWTYSGFLDVRDSLLIYNGRDVWGRAWDDWTVHADQMVIRDNTLSRPDPDFPDNRAWDPQADPNQAGQLGPFLPTPAGTVGVGWAVHSDVLDRSELPGEVPVRLSTFTPQVVTVDYSVETEAGTLDSGQLRFMPGETVQTVSVDPCAVQGLARVRLTLANPANAEVTGTHEVTYQGKVSQVLIRQGAVWRYLKGTQEPPVDWASPSFDDAAWLSGPTGIGYEADQGYESCIATNLADMRGHYLSVYARCPFVIDDPSRLAGLVLTMDWDDGYIAYLNGVRVASRYAPDPATHDRPATTSNHEACCGTCVPEEIDLSGYLDVLVAGVNVLAVQVHNTSVSSSDFLLVPELSATEDPPLDTQ